MCTSASRPSGLPFRCARGAVAVARELARRRPDTITDAWWKEERGERVFIDFNQNAPHKTIFGAWSVRARPDANVSTPFAWDELDDVDPEVLTMMTVPERVATLGDPWEQSNARPQSLQPLLDMYDRDIASGLQDAPWPPVYPKMPGEPLAGRAEPGEEACGRETGQEGRQEGGTDEEEGDEEAGDEEAGLTVSMT